LQRILINLLNIALVYLMGPSFRSLVTKSLLDIGRLPLCLNSRGFIAAIFYRLVLAGFPGLSGIAFLLGLLFLLPKSLGDALEHYY